MHGLIVLPQGPKTVTKLSLHCGSCEAIYNYSMYGYKLTTGERYYDQSREVVEASDVTYIDGSLYTLFKSLR